MGDTKNREDVNNESPKKGKDVNFFEGKNLFTGKL